MTEVTIAAFDFDETLSRRDSVIPFLRRIAGARQMGTGLAVRSPQLMPALLRRDRNQVRAIATRQVFAGRPISQIEQHAAVYGDLLAEQGLRDDMVARLHWHRQQGHLTLIVSASYEHYLREVQRRLGVDDVLATRLEVVDDRCTGELDGANCRGPEKARRLHEWLAGHGWTRDDVTLWAYGDSSGDRELLAMADHPVWVRGPLDSVAPIL